MSEPLYFIQPHILDRLRSGQFVPERCSQLGALRDPPGPERRVTVSPLAVAKRCIRYEPLVFFNRLPELFLLADALNPPQDGQVSQKLLLLEGPSGCGKTTLMRGIIELMGGGPEQLLWIELSHLSDPELMIRFMFEQLMKQARSRIVTEGFLAQGDPLQTISQLLKALPDWPVLIVIDQVNFWVGTATTPAFISPLLKDALNFLLDFPQIKLVLIGERLPLADLSPNHPACFHHCVEPLAAPKALTLLKAALHKGAAMGNEWAEAVNQPSFSLHPDWCLPEPLRFLGKLASLPGVTTTDQITPSGMLEQPPQANIKGVLQALWNALENEAKILLGFLLLLEHPVDVSALARLMLSHRGAEPLHTAATYQFLSPQPLNPSDCVRQLLKSPLLSPLLRYGLSPQYALLTLEMDTEVPEPPLSHKPLFMTAQPMAVASVAGLAQHVAYQVAPWLQPGLHAIWVEQYSPEDRAAFHQTLSTYYQQQANDTIGLTQSQTSPERLLSEARRHDAQARLLLQSMGLDPAFNKPLFIAEKPLERPPLSGVSPPKAEGSWSIRSYLAQKN